MVRCECCGSVNRVPAAGNGVPRCGNCHQPLPWIADADDRTFFDVAEHSAVPVLVDMWATWCAPCRQVGTALEKVVRGMKGRVKLVKVDIDRAPGLRARFGVRAVPTILLLRGGREIDRQAGAAPAPVLREWVERSLTG